ncbi:SMI1/KNR4 family protein [Streptomyces roseirectus]|uniref:SMI1/KNR4 family protein n=1 Tax=Streptomyces roseirectus TaxID=2768066 RepID=A0A7H0IJ38_9ACTN|nr:SMI1/KNR4 family protein [Streptomyces roseirectus]QNP72804.1 SMI1/KNR4 family protein [Streptomyces roseirectus]
MPALYDFATWAPMLRVIRESNAAILAVPGGYVQGNVGQGSWSVPVRRVSPPPGQAAQLSDMQEEWDAVELVRGALVEAGVERVPFVVECTPQGAAVLRLFGPHPHVESGADGPQGGALILVDDAVPAPWRRLPAPVPGAVPAPTADPGELGRVLRERLPDAVGASEEELAEAEARLGVVLPEELKALYRVVRGRWEDWEGDFDVADRVAETVGCELLPLDQVFVADVSTRPCPWRFAAMEAAVTRADDAVQGVVGSPGWIVFGDNGGGDSLVVDLTPGPQGYVGQVVLLSHEANIGGELLADSLTDLVLRGEREDDGRWQRDELPEVARVHHRALRSVEAAAHPALEVLSLGVWDEEPFSLAPVVGLPHLRTLTAYPGTLADPLEIASLPGLEYLELPPEYWRPLLDAGAVPPTLLAASIETNSHSDHHHPLTLAALADEILAQFGRPAIPVRVLEGDLGPVGG